MKLFTIIGNCQAHILSDFLLTNNFFKSQYNYCMIPGIHVINENDIDLLMYIIKKVDLIIIQPIHSNYKNITNLDTYSILTAIKPTCKVILFPSMHLDFYYPFLTYKVRNDGDILRVPCDYHDSKLFELIKESTKNNLSLDDIINNFISIVSDESIKSVEELNSIFKNSISELQSRENKYIEFIPDNCKLNVSIITSSSFIENNYKDKLLFYSMNHPTKNMFHYIADSVLDIIHVNKEQYPNNLDPLLYNNVPILYKCIKQIVNFDISEVPIVINGVRLSIDECINKYYEVYSKINYNEYK